MSLDLSIFITYIGIIVLIFAFGKLFLFPIKVVLKVVLNSILGGILLMVFNMLGQSFGVMIPFNVLNAGIVGILGLPGVIMLLLLTR